MIISREFELIERIRTLVGPPSPRVLSGIGDDAAVVEPVRGKLLATVDALVEGVHFDLAYSLPEEIGHKALAVNLSDIAAMAGEPLYALVSLGLREGLGDDFVERFYRGMKRLADRFGVEIIGGNLTRSPGQFFVDVTLLGQATQPVTRATAREGQLIALVGTIGEAAGGLAVLKRWGKEGAESFSSLIRAQLTPEPRVREAQVLAEVGAISAMIDISDGLVNELHHLAEASGVAMFIDEEALPLSADLKRASAELADDSVGSALEWALQGGEDYALLLTLDVGRVEAGRTALKALGGPELVLIGKVLSPKQGAKVQLQTRDRGNLAPCPKGWSHF